jgi:hypothetical protein
MTGAQLVECVLCGAVVDSGSARQREISSNIQGVKMVWICNTCLHLGSEEQTRKYIKKEQKTVGG